MDYSHRHARTPRMSTTGRRRRWLSPVAAGFSLRLARKRSRRRLKPAATVPEGVLTECKKTPLQEKAELIEYSRDDARAGESQWRTMSS